MVAADVGRAVLIASIPVASAMNALSMPQLYVVGFLSGSLAVVFALSGNTLLTAVTKRGRYVEAIALLNGSRSLASVGGPTIGGLLVRLLGAPLAMLVDALSRVEPSSGSIGGSGDWIRRRKTTGPRNESTYAVPDSLDRRLRVMSADWCAHSGA